MLDHVTPLQIPGRMADQQVEAAARRLAREAGGTGDTAAWLAARAKAIVRLPATLLVRVHPGEVKAGPRLRSGSRRPTVAAH